MKISKIDQNILIKNILDLEKYPDIFNTVTNESKILSGNRGGRKMCRMTNPGMKYTIGGKPYSKRNFTQTVIDIKKDIEDSLSFVENYFNTCTLNYYPNGNSGFRQHTDYMPDLERPMIIATLTLGNSNRDMELTDRKTGQNYFVKLEHNSLLLMGPYMQLKWLHGIPKVKGSSEPRLSLSFRRQKEHPNSCIPYLKSESTKQLF